MPVMRALRDTAALLLARHHDRKGPARGQSTAAGTLPRSRSCFAEPSAFSRRSRSLGSAQAATGSARLFRVVKELFRSMNALFRFEKALLCNGEKIFGSGKKS